MRVPSGTRSRQRPRVEHVRIAQTHGAEPPVGDARRAPTELDRELVRVHDELPALGGHLLGGHGANVARGEGAVLAAMTSAEPEL
jgi:hypothetical protein